MTAHKLQTLKQTMLADEALQASPLAQTATQLVFGSGRPEAEIVIVGEAPGADEDRLGKPFVGRAGEVLKNCLKLVNLSFADVWITNLVKYRPPSNRDPSPAEKALFATYLERELSLIQPRFILALGRHAGRYFFEGLNLAEHHGQVLVLGRPQPQPWQFKFSPLYHPAAALYNPQLLPIMHQDFLNIFKV